MNEFRKDINNKGFTPHYFLWGKFNQVKTTKKSGGFTLVEILVALSIFVMLVMIISGLFVQAIRGQRRNLAYQELLDQTSYVMEYMSRAIRMAMKDDIAIWGFPATNCLAGDKINYATTTVGGRQCLYFRNYKNECQYFCLDGTKLVTATTTSVTAPSSSSFIDLTSPNLNVSSFNIGLVGEKQSDTLQPLVIIDLTVEGRERTTIRIRTSVSQRNLDTQK